MNEVKYTIALAAYDHDHNIDPGKAPVSTWDHVANNFYWKCRRNLDPLGNLSDLEKKAKSSK